MGEGGSKHAEAFPAEPALLSDTLEGRAAHSYRRGVHELSRMVADRRGSSCRSGPGIGAAAGLAQPACCSAA